MPVLEALKSSDRLSRADVAEMLAVHPLTVDRWCRCGVHGVKLRRFHVGNRVVILQADLEAFLQAQNAPRDDGAVCADADEDATAAEAELAAMGVPVAGRMPR